MGDYRAHLQRRRVIVGEVIPSPSRLKATLHLVFRSRHYRIAGGLILLAMAVGCSSTSKSSSTATTTNPTPTSTTVPTSPLFYSPASFWNTPIGPKPSIDPNSAAMVATLEAGANQQRPIAWVRYSVPVYYANAATARVNVSLNARYSAGATELTNVPIPSNAKPAAGSDAAMTIFDTTTGCEYDFFQARESAAGSWSASTGNALVGGIGIGSGTFVSPANPARGSSFALPGGVILPEELATGQINHALLFALDAGGVAGGGPVRPSYNSDGIAHGLGLLPEGAHVQLDPSLNLYSLRLRENWQITIARAMQTYGMYLGDKSGPNGGITLYALDPKSDASLGPFDYPWGNTEYPTVPAVLYQHLRVLALRPQQSQSYSIVQPPGQCGSSFR